MQESHLDIERSRANLGTFLEICRRRGRILVLMQNNPDPDALASAAAVRELVHARLNKRITIAYGGHLGRAENRSMVHELRIDVKHVTPKDLERYKTLCLVDTQPRAGNNALFTLRPADIVIDHHDPPRKPLGPCGLRDVRPEYGATSTILYEYLLAAGIKPDAPLATALYYGIQSDTQELGRDTAPADIEAFQRLLLLRDRKKLSRIQRAPVSPQYFECLWQGLNNAELAGSAVLTLLRNADNPDIFAEVADLMLRLDCARTSVCYGPCNGVIHLSARASDARGNLSTRIRRVVKGIGTGGGHRSMAGGQITVTGDGEKRLQTVRTRLLRVFARDGEPKPLLDPRERRCSESEDKA